MSSPSTPTSSAPPLPARRPRPLSPHLQIYRPQLTSMLSISHRLTGATLSFGLLILAGWLAALAGGPDSYDRFVHAAQGWFGRLILIGLSLAFFYHLCNGIRHLCWDALRFLDLPSVYRSGYIVIAATLVLTLLTWLYAFGALR